jgi:ssDNA-binding Zn-finger/Zn-ribbon topoisomerase 1
MGGHRRYIGHQKCPKCGTTMVKFYALRSRRKPHSIGFEEVLVSSLKCPKCGCERSIKETPLQKEKPRESRKIVVHSPQEILSR